MRRRRWGRRAVLALVAVALLLGLAWVFRWPLLGGTIRRAIAGALAEKGLGIQIERLEGSLLFDLTIEGTTLYPLTPDHVVRSASVARLHATYSLPGLFSGAEGWLGPVEVEGVSLLADAAGRIPGTGGGGGGSGPSLAPDSFCLSGADVTIERGENLLSVTGGYVTVDREGEKEWRGVAGAARVATTIEGRDQLEEAPRVELLLSESGILVRGGARAGGVPRRYLKIRRAGETVEGELSLRLLGGSVAGTVKTRGDIVTADLDLADLDPAPVLAFLPDLDATCDRVSGHVAVSLVRSREALSGRFGLTLLSPRIRGRGVARVEVSGTYEDRRITVKGSASGPELGFSGTIDLEEPVAVGAEVTLGSVDLSAAKVAVAGRTLSGIADGTASVRGPLSSPVISAELTIRRPALGKFEADRLFLDGSATLTDLSVNRLEITRGADEVSASGVAVFGGETVFSGRALARIGSLARLRREIFRELPADLEGAVVMAVTAAGTPDEPHAEVVFSGEDLVAEGVPARSLEATIYAPDLRRLRVRDLHAVADWIEIAAGEVDVTLPGAGEDAEATAVDGEVAIGRLPLGPFFEFVGIPPWPACDLAGTLAVSGPVKDLSAHLRLDGENLRCTIPGREPVTARRVEILGAYRKGRAVLTGLTARGPEWELRAEGVVDADPLRATAPEYRGADLTGRIRLTRVPLGLTGPLPGLAVSEGTVAADLSVSGCPEEPRAAGRFSVTARRILAADPGVPAFTDVELRGSLDGFGAAGGHLALERASVASEGSRLTVRRLDTRLRTAPFGLLKPHLDARVECPDVTPWARRFGLPELSGGTLDLALGIGEGARLTVRGRDLTLRGDPLEKPERKELDLVADLNEGTLAIRGAELRSGKHTIRLDATVPVVLGFAPPEVRLLGERPLSVILTGKGLDIADLDLGEVVRLGGEAEVELFAKGRPGALDLGGRIGWTQGHLRAPGAPPLDEIEGAFRLRGNRVEVESFSARIGHGPVTAGGYAELARREDGGLALAALDLAVSARHALLVRDDALRLRADFDTRVTGGGPEPLAVRGTVDIVSLHYLENVEVLTSRPSLAPLPLTEDPLVAPVRLDLDVRAPPGSLKVRNNLLDASLGGRLSVRGTVAVPRIDGRILAERGKVHLPAVTMNVESATFTFRPERPLSPEIRAHLSTTAARVTADAQISGTPDALEITATSVPPMPSEDVVTLLATGEVPSSLRGSSAASVAATILYRRFVAEFSGNGEESTSGLAGLASRVEEVSVNSAEAGPEWRATIRLAGHWLYLRAEQAGAFDYGLDLLFRLSYR